MTEDEYVNMYLEKTPPTKPKIYYKTFEEYISKQKIYKPNIEVKNNNGIPGPICAVIAVIFLVLGLSSAVTGHGTHAFIRLALSIAFLIPAVVKIGSSIEQEKDNTKKEKDYNEAIANAKEEFRLIEEYNISAQENYNRELEEYSNAVNLLKSTFQQVEYMKQYYAEKNKLKEEISRIELLIKGCQADIVECAQEIHLAERYYNDEKSISSIIEILKNGRADTLKEALNVYESDLRLEAIHLESVRQRIAVEERNSILEQSAEYEKKRLELERSNAEQARIMADIQRRELEEQRKALEEQRRNQEDWYAQERNAREKADHEKRERGRRQCDQCYRQSNTGRVCYQKDYNDGSCSMFEGYRR